MKKLQSLKTIQLVILVILTILSFLLIFTDVDIKVALSIPAVRKLRMLLWFSLAAGYLFVFLDYNAMKKAGEQLTTAENKAVSDTLSKIANRVALDAKIRTYDENQPADLACMILRLDNLDAINNSVSRKSGDQALADFAAILSFAAGQNCFIGRNGGNNFLAIFDTDTANESAAFLNRIKEQIVSYNADTTHAPLKLAMGKAETDDTEKKNIHQLIAAAENTCTRA